MSKRLKETFLVQKVSVISVSLEPFSIILVMWVPHVKLNEINFQNRSLKIDEIPPLGNPVCQNSLLNLEQAAVKECKTQLIDD